MKIFTSYFTLSFLIILFYNFDFSYKYPRISEMSYIVIILTILLLIPTYFLEKKIKYKIIQIKIEKQIYIYLFFSLLNFCYEGKVPLLEIIKKTGYSYKDFNGIPILNVIILTYGIYLSVLASYNLVVLKTKSNIKNYILVILPFLLLYSRFMIIFSILTGIFSYIKIKRNRLRFKFCIIFFSLSFLNIYLFGILGNIRSGYKYNDNTMILSVGGANERFLTSNIPKEFFWFYSYLTSSQANFEKTVLLQKPKENFKEFVVFSLLPEFVKKRLTIEERSRFIQISTALNGAPDITFPYVYYGWSGVIIFVILKSLYINIYTYIIIKRKNEYIIPNLSIIVCFLFLNFINNFYIYGGTILVTIYPLILKGKRRKIGRKKS